jgi:DNA-binding transcriptional LysR family regulator
MVVNGARRGRDAARAAAEQPTTLVLGAVPSATASLVPRTVARLLAEGGPASLIVTALTPQLAAMVLTRELDAAVVTDAPPGLPRDGELRAVHLQDDELVVLARKGHPLSGPDRVTVTDLAEETWVEDNPGSETILRQLATRAGFEPHISRTTDDLFAKTGLVAAGLGIALVPDLMVPAMRSDLTALRLTKPAERGAYLIARRDRNDFDDLLAALSEPAVDPATR